MIHATKGILEGKDTNVWSALTMTCVHHVMKMGPEALGTL